MEVHFDQPREEFRAMVKQAWAGGAIGLTINAGGYRVVQQLVQRHVAFMPTELYRVTAQMR